MAKLVEIGGEVILTLLPICESGRERVPTALVCKLLAFGWRFYLLNPCFSRLGFYEFAVVCLSVRQSVRPSGVFLRIGSLVFSDFLHELRGPY